MPDEKEIALDDNAQTELAKTEILEEIKSAKEIPEIRQEKINTVADFVKELEESLSNMDDEKERIEIAYHIARINGALRMADTKAEKIRIGALKDGRLSVYDRNQQTIKVDEDLLENIADYGKVMGLAVKEAEMEKGGILDVGFQQLVIAKSGISSGEYHKKEKWSVARIFGKWGQTDVLDLYSIKTPKKLADYFLEKEIDQRLKKGRKLKAEEIAPYLEKQFKLGAPILYKKLMQAGYGFRGRAREIIARFANAK